MTPGWEEEESGGGLGEEEEEAAGAGRRRRRGRRAAWRRSRVEVPREGRGAVEEEDGGKSGRGGG